MLIAITSNIIVAKPHIEQKIDKPAALQPKTKLSVIAKLTATIMSSQHYTKKPIDDNISRTFFNEYFKTIDPNKVYLTKEDINKFKKYETSLDDDLLRNNTEFAYEAYNLLVDRIFLYRDFVYEQINKKFNFELNETYQIDRSKVERANNLTELKDIWRKRIKNELIAYTILDENRKKDDKVSAFHGKRTPEENVLNQVDQFVKRFASNRSIDVLEYYLNTLTKIYDPHSSYMAPVTKKDFDIEMKLSFGGIGAVLTSDEGYTEVVRLIPGGPAEKSKLLHPNDRIIAVSQDGEDPVNIVDMPLSKVVNLIRGKKKTKVLLTILEASKGVNALPKVITIVRDTVKLKDAEASGKIEKIKIDGKEKNIGIITLPSFYMDFAAAQKGEDYKSASKDVLKIINDFNSKNVEGIIFDIRSNGGGSLFDAVKLTGLFINDGPVVNVKETSGKISILRDKDSKIQFTKPMVVLINRLSASASEIFAAALKDYDRAVIVGEKSTHGKGTVQTIFDLDRVIKFWGIEPPAGSVKFTTAKFYRINGESTQLKGVHPDIVFPSFSDVMDLGEASLKHALPWDTIPGVEHKDYQPDLAKIIKDLKKKSDERTIRNTSFKLLKEEIANFKKIKDTKNISLNLNERKEQYKKEKEIQETQNKVMKLDNIGAARDKKDKKTKVDDDIFLQESINILKDLIIETSKK
jgi:carboxyl-terminal processing protease